jgi:hypothetical protein
MQVDPALLRLRLAGFTDARRLAQALGETPEATTDALELMHEAGWARYRDGRAAGVASGWALTPSGRAEAHRQLAAEVDATGCRRAVESAYRSFLAVNPSLLEVLTDWQVRAGVVNDHRDRRYDRRVLARLDRINEKISPVLVELADCVERYRSYRPRLDAALDRARSGELEYVDRPVVDSYHTVWFELHEDLLATLGLDRSQERDGPAKPDEPAEPAEQPPEVS